jgi:hypothetical protein
MCEVDGRDVRQRVSHWKIRIVIWSAPFSMAAKKSPNASSFALKTSEVGSATKISLVFELALWH